mgnify:CR=1 FL=1
MLDDDGRVGAQAASLTGRLTLDPKRADLMLPLSGSYRSATGFSQHPDQHRSERPILLAVDQELGERPRLWGPPVGPDPVGAIEVGQHQDVKQFRTGSWPEGIEAFTELTLDLLQVHGVGLAP